MPTFLDVAVATIRSLLTWRSLFFLLALINTKNLPFAWHVRLFYEFARHMRRPPGVKQIISTPTDSTIHPVFRPISIFSRSPLLETDYNLHKSNSTYFSDLDISRTALVTSLLSAGFRSGNAALEAEGHKGPNNVILGSVHTTFHKEVRPYEQYEVRSRLLGWDQKWLLILSTFIRPKQGTRGEVVLASALSKYVIKKARYTVPPVQCLESAGWFEGIDRDAPDAEEGKSEAKKLKGILKVPPATQNYSLEASPTESTVLVNRPHEEELQAVDVSKLEAKAEEMSAMVDEKWGETLSGSVAPVDAAEKAADLDGPERPAPARRGSRQPWTWEMVEKERCRGLEIARAWMALDGALAHESSRVQS